MDVLKLRHCFEAYRQEAPWVCLRTNAEDILVERLCRACSDMRIWPPCPKLVMAFASVMMLPAY